MLDEIAEGVISGKLQDIFIKDPEYKRLSREEKLAAEKCRARVPEEYWKLVENLTDSMNVSCARLIDLAYRQGMMDCAELMVELKVKEKPDDIG